MRESVIELARRPAWAMSALVLAASLVLGLTLLRLGILPVAGVLAAGLVVLFPRSIPFYLIGLAFLQPLALRLVPAASGPWFALKRVDEVSLALLLPLALVAHFVRGTRPLPRRTLWALALVVGLGVAASAFRGTAPWLVGLDAFLLLKGFAAFAIFSAVPLGPARQRQLLCFALALAVFAGVVGLAELAFPSAVRGFLPLERETVRAGLLSLISIFDNAGQAGFCFAFAAATCFAFYLVYRRNGLLVAFSLLALCAVLTLRRKPIAGLALALLAAVPLTRRTGNAARAALVLVAVGVLGFAFFGDTVGVVFAEGYETYVASADPTRVARNAMYLASVRLATDHFPLGVGFGLFGGYVSQLHYSPLYIEYGLSTIWGLSPTHNQFMLDAFWPHVLGQFGVFGFAAFVLALCGIWQPLLRAGATESPLRRALGLAATLTLLEALVESVALPVFEGTTSSVLLFGLAALASEEAGRAPGATPGEAD